MSFAERFPATDADIPPSDATNGEAEGVGVYVCHCGGNIADVVDVARVTEVAGRLPGVVDHFFSRTLLSSVMNSSASLKSR